MNNEKSEALKAVENKILEMRNRKAAKLGHVVTYDQVQSLPETQTQPTVEAVKLRADQLIKDNANVATKGTYMEYGSREIQMQSPDGRIIRIEKVTPGRAKEDYAIQDVLIGIDRGTSTMREEAIHYNYNQYSDGLMRKKVFSGNGVHIDELPEDSAVEDLIEYTHKLDHATNEGIANKQLEEDMGLDNQPVSHEDLVDIASLLDTCVMIDPRLGPSQ
jgi:hypothetical protein